MVKPFRLTYLAGGGGGGGEGCHRTGDREVVVFDRFQRYVEIVRKLMKSAITLSFSNLMT